jgi:predicted HicB family RNase H-like nuclease
MGNVVKNRIFMDNAHNYLLRVEEGVFQEIIQIAYKKQSSVNTILNEAIEEYLEKNKR